MRRKSILNDEAIQKKFYTESPIPSPDRLVANLRQLFHFVLISEFIDDCNYDSAKLVSLILKLEG